MIVIILINPLLLCFTYCALTRKGANGSILQPLSLQGQVPRKTSATMINANTTHSRHSAYVYAGSCPLQYINKTGAPYSFARRDCEIS